MVTVANVIYLILALAVALSAPVVVSMIVEAVRRPPATPDKLYWNAQIPVLYTDVSNMKIRYIKTGAGPNLLLLHTLRTQLDIFQRMVAELSRDFTVYALDYPGHGFSEIVKTDYVPELFVDCVEGFMQKLNLENATLAGVSIGGTIPLLIAAKQNARVRKVIAINVYDYARGLGVARGNFVAWLIIALSRIPVIGETVMRFRQPFIERLLMEGGVAAPASLPREFLKQVFETGERTGHYRGFINLLRNAGKWEDAHAVYGRIRIPVLLVYGDRDWSNESERRRTAGEIPGARLEIVKDGGHFLSLDQPERLVTLMRQFAKA